VTTSPKVKVPKYVLTICKLSNVARRDSDKTCYKHFSRLQYKAFPLNNKFLKCGREKSKKGLNWLKQNKKQMHLMRVFNTTRIGTVTCGRKYFFFHFKQLYINYSK
jgi:hypothetical protein